MMSTPSRRGRAALVAASLALFCVTVTLTRAAAADTTSSPENIVANGNFQLLRHLNKSAVRGALSGVPGWSITHGGVNLINNGLYYGSVYTTNRKRRVRSEYSVQLPSVPGRSIYQVLPTEEGMSYYASLNVQSAWVGEHPAYVMVSLVDEVGNQIFADLFHEKMTRAWTTKHFTFDAVSNATTITFSSVGYDGFLTSTKGAAISRLVITPIGSSSRRRLLQTSLSHSTSTSLDSPSYLDLSADGDFHEEGSSLVPESTTFESTEDSTDSFMLENDVFLDDFLTKDFPSLEPENVNEDFESDEPTHAFEGAAGSADLADSVSTLTVDLATSASTLSADLAKPVSTLSAELAESVSTLSADLAKPVSTLSAVLAESVSTLSADLADSASALSTDLAESVSTLSLVEPLRATSTSKLAIRVVEGDMPVVPPIVDVDPSVTTSLVKADFLEDDFTTPLEIDSVEFSMPTDKEVPLSGLENASDDSTSSERRSLLIRRASFARHAPPPPRRRPPPPHPPSSKHPHPPPPKKHPPPPKSKKYPPPPKGKATPARHPPPPKKKSPPSPPPKKKSPPPPKKKSPPPPKKKHPPPPPKKKYPPPPKKTSSHPYPPPPPRKLSNLQATTPLTPILIAYNADNANIVQNSVSLSFYGAAGGSRFQSTYFSSGLFQATITCPPSSAAGILSSFYLDSGFSTAVVEEGFGFDFPGNNPSVAYATWTLAGLKQTYAITLGFDCSTTPTTYSLFWDSAFTAWYVGSNQVHVITNNNVGAYIRDNLYVFGSISDASEEEDGAYAGVFAGDTSKKYTATFANILIRAVTNSSLVTVTNVTKVNTTFPGVGPIMYPITPDYCNWQCLGCTPDNTNGNATIRWTNPAECGSRWSSPTTYSSYVVSADIKCADNDTSGMITSFYTASIEGSVTQDEIDYEFIGKNKTIIQTNYYVLGQGGHELWINLGFDSSLDFHNYAIVWTSESIIWYVDYKPVRIVLKETGKPYPVKPQYLYGGMWDASGVCGGCWTGIRKSYTYATDFVWYVRYRNIRITPSFHW
eukprot:TRINITY_DN2685_c1_g1_i1.p1 TRINITY_DN2685_c1_g1~~TRINITY_DN2685_c1_g1_i1.p1  ORF type:complete len:1040 (+),score=114.34 TRINITY_DN2685_c1_g1_i1:112-3231(+)